MKHLVNNVRKWPSFSIAYILLALLILVLLQSWLAPNVENVSYSKFKKYITDRKINSGCDLHQNSSKVMKKQSALIKKNRCFQTRSL